MAKITGQLMPKIPQAGLPGFLLWSRRESPALYSALVDRFPEVANFEEQYKNSVDAGAGMGCVDCEPRLDGFMDIMSSIGSGLASAAGSIGSFISANGSTIFSAAGGYMVAQQQNKIAQAQLKLALAVKPPLQTAIVQTANGPVSVPVQPSGTGYTYAQYAAPANYGGTGGSIISSIANVSMTTWLMIGGGVAALALLMRRR